MPRLMILVNGLPGAGKTTLASRLAPELDAVLVSKDKIKEALADAPELAPELVGSLGAAAMETAWSIAQDVPGSVVVESWWFAPRDRGHLQAALERVRAERVVEVWCDATVHVARRRFSERARHAIHNDAERLATDWDHWAQHAQPLALCPVVTVRTDRDVDVRSLAREIACGGRFSHDTG